MAYGKISEKQREILEYIKSEILNKGYPPAVRDICEAVHLKSTSSVHAHLETLEKNGYIRRDPTKPRAIEIIDDNFNLVRREVVYVPLLGRVAAGEPLLAVENVETYFPVPSEFMPNQNCFMLEVKGESMVNAGIFDGDNILVMQQSRATTMSPFWASDCCMTGTIFSSCSSPMPRTATWSWLLWTTPPRSRPSIRRMATTAFSRRTIRWTPLSWTMWRSWARCSVCSGFSVR